MLSNNIFTEKTILLIIVSLTAIILLIIFLTYKKNNGKKIETKTIEQINTDELTELKSSSKVLEDLAKQKAIEMTPYEEEQEEKAIISYEELLSKTQNVSISYSDSTISDDISIKKVDLEKTGKIELDPIKKETNTKIPSLAYAHEEEFLNTLKQLQKLIN